MNSIVVKNKICCIYLDNQPQNYLTRPEFVSPKELEDAVLGYDCIAIIISGMGRHFSAGADISTIHEMSNTGILSEELTAGKNLFQKIKSFNIPIIACIEGVCMGAGMEIALNADVCFASSKALFAFPESQANLLPGLTGTVKLTTAIGKKAALELILKGEIIDAQTALDLNIIDEICEPKKTVEKGLQFIENITLNRPKRVINAVVEAIRNAETLSIDAALKRETELFCELAKQIEKEDN